MPSSKGKASEVVAAVSADLDIRKAIMVTGTNEEVEVAQAATSVTTMTSEVEQEEDIVVAAASASKTMSRAIAKGAAALKLSGARSDRTIHLP